MAREVASVTAGVREGVVARGVEGVPGRVAA